LYDKIKTSSAWAVHVGGDKMFTVTDKAAQVIQDFLKDKEKGLAVRITLSIG